jgi:hypothetical protein
MTSLSARLPNRVTPRRPGGAGAPRATTLAHTADADVERAMVGTTLITRVVRGVPVPPGLPGAVA